MVGARHCGMGVKVGVGVWCAGVFVGFADGVANGCCHGGVEGVEIEKTDVVVGVESSKVISGAMSGSAVAARLAESASMRVTARDKLRNAWRRACAVSAGRSIMRPRAAAWSACFALRHTPVGGKGESARGWRRASARNSARRVNQCGTGRALGVVALRKTTRRASGK